MGEAIRAGKKSSLPTENIEEHSRLPLDERHLPNHGRSSPSDPVVLGTFSVPRPVRSPRHNPNHHVLPQNHFEERPTNTPTTLHKNTVGFVRLRLLQLIQRVDPADQRHEELGDADVLLRRDLDEPRLEPVGERLPVLLRDDPLVLEVALAPDDDDRNLVGPLCVSPSNTKPGR